MLDMKILRLLIAVVSANHGIRMMTRNVYFGSDLTPVLAAMSEAAFLQAAGGVVQGAVGNFQNDAGSSTCLFFRISPRLANRALF